VDENKFCVYVHCDENNSPFYVGSGTLRRANDIPKLNKKDTKRGGDYRERVLSIGFKVKVLVLQCGLSKPDSIELEKFLYDALKPLLTNKRRPTGAKKLDVKFLSQYVYYSEESKTCLKWNLNSSYTTFGEDAGCFNNGLLSIRQTRYLISRVVAELHGLSTDGKLTDHIDGDRCNNKISNIRLVTPSVNSKNRVMNSNNTTGIVGVVYCKVAQTWNAVWCENGKGKAKRFSIKKFGESAKLLAYQHRLSKLMEQGDYTDRHIGEFK
jgi:hypothetical protein